jgi:membrane protease YdiL (CAAX protease family)
LKTEAGRSFNRLGFNLVVILLLFTGYTIIFTIHPGDAVSAVIELIPGIVGVAFLLFSGFTPEQVYLRLFPISKRGFLVLALFTLAMIPVMVTGKWVGWNWLPVLVYAPASGIGQELFFRAALLPVLMRIFGGKPLLAVFVHALLFSLWHIPLAFTTAPLPGAIAVTIVTFIGGMAWGWQVQKDRTIYWAMAQHTLYLMVMALFIW